MSISLELIFTKFCMQIPCGRHWVLLWRHCTKWCTSAFMDDVTFGCSLPYGDAWLVVLRYWDGARCIWILVGICNWLHTMWFGDCMVVTDWAPAACIGCLATQEFLKINYAWHFFLNFLDRSSFFDWFLPQTFFADKFTSPVIIVNILVWWCLHHF